MLLHWAHTPAPELVDPVCRAEGRPVTTGKGKVNI